MELEKLLDSEIDDCPCGEKHRIPTREVHLQAGSLQNLPQVADRSITGKTIVCVADANTWSVAGEEAVRILSGNGRQVTTHFVDRHVQPAHADRSAVDELLGALTSNKAAGAVAVGSGTINDIAKSAATVADCPLITVATAASMNGYPSAISALTDQGVKITEPCRPPVAIIADPQVLSTAPPQMTGAGFGDLLSKNASTADWLVAHTLHGEYYCAFSAEVAEEAVNRCIDNAAAIRLNEPDGLTVLAEALVRSGISMVIAGSSAPASGGEHLISHLWDMTAHWNDRQPALHGQQTGVTTLISLKLYEKLLALDAEAVDDLVHQKPLAETQTAFEERIQQTFGDLAEAVLPFARQKFLDAAQLQRRRQQIADRWEEIRRAVAPVVIAAESSRDYLEAAGAVFRSADLGISSVELEFAYRHARWIRDRYSVLDLAAELGVLEIWQAEVLSII